ncbi:MAG: glycosyltransferase [Bacillota bacterium]
MVEAAYYGSSRPEVRRLVPSHARCILDVGCGWGRVGAELKASVPGREVTGVEVVPQVAEVAAQALDRVLVGDVEDVVDRLPRRHFDCVILADILEHLRDPWLTLKRLGEAMQPGAAFVASVPNISHWSIIRGLIEGEWHYQDEGLLDRTHLRFFTKSTIRDMFEQAGWRVLRVEAVSKQEGGGVPPSWVEELQRAGVRAHRLVQEAYDYQYLILGCYPGDASCPLPRELASIVLPCCNGVGYTRACIESIFAHTDWPFELIVVDNGSRDGTARYLCDLAATYENVRVVTNKDNLGFGVGCNQGMALARGEYAVLLNNDTVVTEGWLPRLIAHAQADSQTGIVGPRSNWVAGLQLVARTSYGSDLAGLADFAHRWQRTNYGRRRYVDRITGLCMLVKREVLQRMGGFDPRFGIGNFEDDDYCLRARMAGYSVSIADDVFIHHFGHQTFIGQRVDYSALMQRNWQRFCRKWGIDPASPAGCSAQEILSRADQELLYVPLDLKQALRSNGEPLPLWPRDDFSFLVFPDWSDPSSRWSVILRSFCRAFAPEDRVCLVLRADPTEVESMKSVVRAVTEEIEQPGFDPNQIADVVICDDGLGWEDLCRMFRAASAYVPSGELEEGLHRYQAALYGLPEPPGVSPDALRQMVPPELLSCA